MGRKSMVAQRTEEILDAFERCIVEFGFEGATLEKIAEEAEVQRSIIRHYIGNRDGVVTALVDRFMLSYEAEMAQLWTWVRQDKWIPLLLDDLFGEPSAQEAQRNRIFREIFVAGEARYPEAKARFIATYEQMIRQVADALGKLYPQSSAEKRREVAYAMFALSSADNDLQAIGIDPSYRQLARQAAEALIAQLG